MKRIILLIISTFVLSISYAIGQTHNETTSEDTIKSFLTKMYNDEFYEDYDFLLKHCSPELLKKLQDAYPYDSDGPAYATWLFRSRQQDSNPWTKDDRTMMLDVTADDDWYVYTALDMGWDVINRIKVTCEDGKIIITYSLMNLSYDLEMSFVKEGNSIFIDGTEFIKE